MPLARVEHIRAPPGQLRLTWLAGQPERTRRACSEILGPARPPGMRRLDSAGRGPNGTKLADGARFQTLMGPHRTVACQIPDDQLASALHQHLVDRAPRLLMALTGRIRASNTL